MGQLGENTGLHLKLLVTKHQHFQTLFDHMQSISHFE